MLSNIPPRSDLPKNPKDAFPLVFVQDLQAQRAFYLQTLGCTATHDMDEYLQVQLSERPDGPQLCFMKSPAPPATFSQGFVLSVPVGDVDVLEGRLDQAGVTLRERPTDRPWGWRSLHVVDPAGVVLDFFHVVSEHPMDATS